MKQLIKALFAVAVINLLIYAFYSLAFIFVLPSFRSFGLVAISIGLIAFFIARTFTQTSQIYINLTKIYSEQTKTSTTTFINPNLKSTNLK